MSFHEERRSDPRARVKIRAGLTVPGCERAVTVHTLDLSLGGARCVGRTSFEPDCVVQGRLLLPLSEGGCDTDVPIEFEARVVRACELGHGDGRQQEFAVEFTSVRDADRDEIRRFILGWLADDSLVHDSLVETS